MIKIKNTDVWGFEHAIRGMRNPLNSWEKSDSGYGCKHSNCDCCYESNECNLKYDEYILGERDLDLATKLVKAGTDHRKFIRQIIVSVDITAPLYWWKEFDTYKVGTVANSTSTMHKITAKGFTMDDFSIDDTMKHRFIGTILECENLRREYMATNDKTYWRALIQLLPCSYNQMRTVTMNYENLRNMYHARKNHKLTEWHEFCKWVETLPYAKEFIL